VARNADRISGVADEITTIGVEAHVYVAGADGVFGDAGLSAA
jgi:hypothetical protein